jgi:hypothetical protein
MIGLIRQRAHICCSYIEQVVVVAGVIGQSASEMRMFLDQCHAKVRGWIAKQLIGEQNAARTPADDDRLSRGPFAPTLAQSLIGRQGHPPSLKVIKHGNRHPFAGDTPALLAPRKSTVRRSQCGHSCTQSQMRKTGGALKQSRCHCGDWELLGSCRIS